MKKLLLIILLIVGAFAQETEMDALEKQMLYKQNDKSPLIAGLCALTPTVGHIYVGEWNKRLLTPTILLGAISVLPIFYAEGTWSYSTDQDKIETAYNISLIPIIAFYYLQMQDAIYLAYQHNADLYKEIYGKEYIRPPKKSLIQKWIDKKEAKKDTIDIALPK